MIKAAEKRLKKHSNYTPMLNSPLLDKIAGKKISLVLKARFHGPECSGLLLVVVLESIIILISSSSSPYLNLNV